MIFVFGSNLAGRHGAGAALTALRYHGAKEGRGIGLYGTSYAIPTKDFALKVLPLPVIEGHIGDFKAYAAAHQQWGFQITRVGCGLAGFTDEQIAPLFLGAQETNCFFDLKWRPFLGNRYEYWGTF
jgi:hypothetical protein